MRQPMLFGMRAFVSLVALFALLFVVVTVPAEARKRSSSQQSTTSSKRSSASTRHSSRRHTASSGRSHRSRRHSTASSSRHHGRHHRASARHAPRAAAKPKYAYPLELFMMSAPEFDRTPFPEETAHKVRHDFHRGIADGHAPSDLVRAGVFHHYPLRGGIFKRREQVKYIIVHSTETGPPVSAKSVIDAWSSLGRRHAGAQYVVERDGTIYQSCDPDLATVHVNIFKTLPGINNDNSVGIEMNHTGKQHYPREQREAVIRLVSYLQDRYNVINENVITHRYAQQGDHTDPVAFDFEGFLAVKDEFHNKALAMKREIKPTNLADIATPPPTIYMELHKKREEEPANTMPSLRTEIELPPDSVTVVGPKPQQPTAGEQGPEMEPEVILSPDLVP